MPPIALASTMALTVPPASMPSHETESFDRTAHVAPTVGDVASVLKALSKKRSPVSHYTQIVLAAVLGSCALFVILFPLVDRSARPHSIGAAPYVMLALCFLLSPLGRHYAHALILRSTTAGLYRPYTIRRFTTDSMVVDEAGHVREIPFTDFVLRVVSPRALLLGNASGGPERVVPMRAFATMRAREAFHAIVAAPPPSVAVSEALHTFGGSEELDDIRFVIDPRESIAGMRIIIGEGWFQFFRAVVVLIPIAAGAYNFVRSGPVTGAVATIFFFVMLAYTWRRAKHQNAASRTVQIELGDVVTFRTAAGTRSWRWDELTERVEDDRLVVLFFVGKRNGLVIPKRVLGARALERIRTRVPARVEDASR